MNSPNPPSPPIKTNASASIDDAVAGDAVVPKRGGGRQWRLWLSGIVAAFLAATLAWLLGESGVTRAAAASAEIPTMGQIVIAPTVATAQAADVKNAVRLFGAFGAILGLLLGLSGGWSRGNVRAAWAAAALGFCGGGVTGAAAPFFVVRAFHHWQSQGADELIYSMGMHSGTLILPGAVAGLALALGLGHKRRLIHAALGGAIGAVVGAIVYDLIGAFAFPFANTGEPLASTAAARFLELILPALAIAAGAVRGARD
jgi:hypothetical protein